MSIDTKQSTANAMLDLFDTLFPAGSILEIRTGAPAGAEAAAGGTLLASITLPATPWSAAAAGVKSKNGTWADVGVAAGNAAHYRLKNAGDTERVEGTVTESGGGGDAIIANENIDIGQPVPITSFTYAIP